MTITQSSTRLVATAVGAVVAFGLLFGAVSAPARAAALSQTQISAIITLLQSFGADAATISNVQASLNGQPTTGSTGGSTGASCTASYTRNLTVGSTGADVMALQKLLNSDAATMVAASGTGSPGSETSYFGPATKAAVVKFQAKHSISPTSGYVGPLTRAQLNSLCSTGSTTGTGTTPTPTAGTGLTVSAAAQPANGLAPATASRIPFTNFTVTAGNDGDVTLNSVTVERGGVASDSSFSGVELVDLSTGVQIGTSRTLNSNHQATIGDSVVIPRGTSKTFTVAANRTSAGSHAGELATFSVIAINSSATVTGSLPITGATQTINESLTIGAVSTSTSAYDPGAAQTKNLGDTAVRYSGIRFTANSSEDLRLYSIRWRQVGSVSASDLSNMVTVVNGTSYAATVDSTGKYFTSVFPGGLLITKGNSIDAYIQGDIVGSNAAARTADFDIDKVTDVYFVGQLYGYGVAPSGTYTPWYDGVVTTINAGTATSISKATEVPAQNIAVNVSNQVLGGFVADFKGEAVSVQTVKITIATSSGFTGNGVITSISLVDENGAIIAGPVDEASTCDTGCTVSFPDTVTFKTGRHVYTITGKIPSGVSNNSTVTVSTNPSTWTSVTGQTSGNTISLSSNTNFAMNTMTVKSAVLAITMSSTPVSQNIVAGGQGVLFGNVQLDASQSGEDIRMSNIQVRPSAITGLTSCQLYNGSTVLNTGSNVPSSLTAAAANTFTFDNQLVITKGTVVTVAIKCNTTTSATGAYTWSVNSADTFSATGVVSGASVSPTVTTGNAGTMTVGSGSLTVTVDASSPSYAVAAGGTIGQTMSVIKFRAANEAINLTDLSVTLTGTASSSVTDLSQIRIYDGATLVGTALITGSNASATTTITGVVLPKDADKTLTVKADIANIGTSQPGTPGNLLKVDPLSAKGTGQSSGTTIQAGAATAGAAGVRIFKTYPTVALETGSGALSSNGISDGRLMRFKVTANAGGPIGLSQFKFTIATTSATVTAINMYGYTDEAYSTPISGVGTGGLVNSSTVAPTATAFTVTPSSIIQVPAAGTYYFQVQGTVSGTGTTYNVATTLTGDSAFPTIANPGATVTKLDDNSTVTGNSNFVWSPNSTTTAVAADNDWTNSFGIPGLPASGIIQNRTQ